MKKILFICTHNRCRSILAEALTTHLVKGKFDVASAGSQPAGMIHPETIKYLEYSNIDTTGLHSKSWNDLENFDPDIVITVCDQAAGEACPVWMGNTLKVHWGLTDPSKLTEAEKIKEAFESVTDILQKRIQFVLSHQLKNMGQDELKSIFIAAREKS